MNTPWSTWNDVINIKGTQVTNHDKNAEIKHCYYDSHRKIVLSEHGFLDKLGH